MCFHEAVRGPNRSLLLTTKIVRFSYPHRNDSSSLLPYLRASALGHVPVVVLKFLPSDILLAVAVAVVVVVVVVEGKQ